jgi:hypothetical protein
MRMFCIPIIAQVEWKSLLMALKAFPVDSTGNQVPANAEKTNIASKEYRTT